MLKHWGLLVKDSIGVTELLDANELTGTREHRVRNFATIRTDNLKMICEIAQLNNDTWVDVVKITAARAAIPMSGDRYFCRTWLMNVLKSLQENGMVLYDEPRYIQRAVEIVNGEFSMSYSPSYHVLAPIKY
ncbi:hypothetical protein F5Y03DRAFT_407806 [Xylaria venustula]|nr:hypothetical protein F5Y03DRAFT_407806 [Xylaria venustula]